MALTPTLVVFDRSVQPNNLLTVADWQRLSREWLGSYSAWRRAVRLYAERTGGALVMRGDDRLVVFTKRADGKISRRTHKPDRWAWSTDRAARMA